MDLTSKIKLGANGVKGRNIYDYTDGEIRQARKEVAEFFKATGQDIELLKATIQGRNYMRDMVFDRLDINRVTPEERKAKKEADIKAGKERFKARMAEEAKKKAERKAKEDAKTPAQKAMDRKMSNLKESISLWQDKLDTAEDEDEYNESEKRIAELKTELAKLK
jgi:hypothetical protein